MRAYATALLVAAFLAACGGSGGGSQTPAPCESGACVVAIAAERAGASCALLASGSVKCWGDNYNYQLAAVAPPYSATPIAVGGLGGASAIALGEGNACAIAGGELWCWGAAAPDYGFEPSVVTTPARFGALTSVADVSLGKFHACVADGGGATRCWGWNAYGEVGDGTTTERLDPVSVPSAAGATAVAVGLQHSCAIVGGGAVTCWGYNGSGQLGDGTTTQRLDPVSAGTLAGVSALALGRAHTCAVLAGGGVSCWGTNYYGELGAVTAVASSTAPVSVPGITGATAIAAGQWHTCAVVSGGSVKCWGRNDRGQLGNGGTTGAVANRTGWAPEQVPGLTGVTAITAGESHTCALIPGAGVKCWGANDKGQLGDRTTTERHAPVDVVF